MPLGPAAVLDVMQEGGVMIPRASGTIRRHGRGGRVQLLYAATRQCVCFVSHCRVMLMAQHLGTGMWRTM